MTPNEVLNKWLAEHEQELIDVTRQVLQIDTIEGPAEPNAPYGSGNRKALDMMLSYAESCGMKTTDLEGHLGYADFGSGDRLVMTLGHLDVVPVGPGWKHEPFGAEIDGGYIYARGAVDDKGPTIASFFALRAIKECFPDLNSRFRAAFGCDEESGFGCVERYAKTEEPPTYGIAPDSGWPCYHGEKGIGDLLVSVKVPESNFQITSLVGGQRPNIVIDQCSALVHVGESVREEVETKVSEYWDKNITTSWAGNTLHIEATGKAAHGSTPFYGDNAATRIVRMLLEVSPLETKEFLDDLLNAFHPSGVGIGIHGRDDATGDLTANVGIVSFEDGAVKLLVNVRYPATWKGEELHAMCSKHLAKLGPLWSFEVERDSPSLYFPLDHPLIKVVVEAYREATGDQKEPGTMGGGTYARAIPNTVSVGTGWLGDGDAHQTDERVAIESLKKMSRIYAAILYRLATV
ncbi:MAG TPA: Sapep family Mn(2+)-dependent dipeptidase [Fimbriimonas sp.]|nr:Sapep family Mn(2+)-dependent dipeptidase [Fimbriimonas sp.]